MAHVRHLRHLRWRHPSRRVGALWQVATCCLLCWLLCCRAGPADAAEAGTSTSVERNVKAGFLYKFLGYVEYPAAVLGDPKAPYTVGVSGADDIAAELVRISAGHSINNRPVTVRVVREGDPLGGLDLLFVGSDTARAGALLRAAQPLPILTVTEADNGMQQGSIINFRLVDERVRFEVALDAADRSNLKLSSRLLSVAYHVQKGNP